MGVSARDKELEEIKSVAVVEKIKKRFYRLDCWIVINGQSSEYKSKCKFFRTEEERKFAGFDVNN